MYGFSSFYWDVADLAEPDRRAVDALDGASPPLPSAGYATHDPDGLLAAYRTLLHSADPPARGVALDQYTYAEPRGAGVPTTPSRRSTTRCSRRRGRCSPSRPIRPCRSPRSRG